MTTDLARWNLLDYQLQLDSKTEPRMAKAKNYTAHTILGGGDTTHTLLMGETIWVRTPHNIGLLTDPKMGSCYNRNLDIF